MKAVRHLGIVVSDLDRALRFYQDLLGLKLFKKMDESSGYLDKISGLTGAKAVTVKLAADDGNLIELLYFSSHPGTSKTRAFTNVGASHAAFTVENLDNEYARLLKHGVQFNSAPQASPDGYAKVAFCKDPDGTLIELVEVLKK